MKQRTFKVITGTKINKIEEYLDKNTWYAPNHGLNLDKMKILRLNRTINEITQVEEGAYIIEEASLRISIDRSYKDIFGNINSHPTALLIFNGRTLNHIYKAKSLLEEKTGVRIYR